MGEQELRKEVDLNFNEPRMWPPGRHPESGFCSEDERLNVLASFGMDELQEDEELNRLSAFAARLCNAEIALVSIVEEERQRFLSHTGLAATETPRSWSFCARAMIGGKPTIIRDAREHPDFADNPLVTSAPFIRFYAGVPLISPEGAPLGTLCVIDSKPRPDGLNEMQLDGLTVLGEAVKRRLSSHRATTEATAAITHSEARLSLLIDMIPDIAWASDAEGEVTYFNRRWYELTGASEDQLDNEFIFENIYHPDDQRAFRDRWLESVATGEPYEAELRVRTRDGDYIWMLSRGVPLRDQSGAITEWFGTLTDIDEGRKVSEQSELLAGELAHRIKNIFSVITGLIALHAQSDPSRKDFAAILSDHVRALARAQEFALQIGERTEDNLHGLLGILMAPYGIPGKSAVSITGDNVHVGVRSATPLALVFHELATNSAKYGALSAASGRVDITVEHAGDEVAIRWQESGGPSVGEPEGSGFGSRLMRMSIEHQMDGSLDQEWRDTGLVAVIRLPVERLAA